MTAARPAMDEGAPIRVAVCAGVVYRHDAISASAALKLDALRGARHHGRPLEPRLFTLTSDRDGDPDVQVVVDPWSLVTDPWFASAAVQVYEFGIYFSLFDAVFAAAPGTSKLGVFHNITPLALVEDADARDAIERSSVQVHNLARCDEVLCDSTFNLETLRGLGLGDVPATVLPLPPLCPAARAREKDGRGSRAVTFLFIGRIVRAKGVLDLIDATERAGASGCGPFRVVIAGSPTFSERGTLAEIQRRLAAGPAGHVVELVLGATDEELADRYADADAVVIPSYHEGYCVPIMEALAHGCHVIAYDAGAVAETAGGLAALVPTGDVAGLATAMAEYVRRRLGVEHRDDVVVPVGPQGHTDVLPHEWRQRAEALVTARSRDAYRDGFLAAVTRGLDRHTQDRPALVP